MNKEEVTALGAPLIKGKTQNMAILHIAQNRRPQQSNSSVDTLQAHDALVILKNSPAMSKLLSLLEPRAWISHSWVSSVISWGLITQVLNVNLNHDQSLQVSLLSAVVALEYEVLGCWHRQPFASAASTLSLHESIISAIIYITFRSPETESPWHMSKKHATVQNYSRIAPI